MAPFVYIFGVIGGMGYYIYISEESLIMNIGFGCSSFAFLITILHLFYSSHLARKSYKIPEGGQKNKTVEANEIPNPGNAIAGGRDIAENYNNQPNNGGNDENQSFGVDIEEIVPY